MISYHVTSIRLIPVIDIGISTPIIPRQVIDIFDQTTRITHLCPHVGSVQARVDGICTPILICCHPISITKDAVDITVRMSTLGTLPLRYRLRRILYDDVVLAKNRTPSDTSAYRLELVRATERVVKQENCRTYIGC